MIRGRQSVGKVAKSCWAEKGIIIRKAKDVEEAAAKEMLKCLKRRLQQKGRPLIEIKGEACTRLQRKTTASERNGFNFKKRRFGGGREGREGSRLGGGGLKSRGGKGI